MIIFQTFLNALLDFFVANKFHIFFEFIDSCFSVCVLRQRHSSAPKSQLSFFFNFLDSTDGSNSFNISVPIVSDWFILELFKFKSFVEFEFFV